MKRFVLALTVLYSSPLYAAQPDAVWTTHSPREEISPKFELKNGVFKIDASGRNGATGQWQTRLAVKGGQHYRFFARRSTHAIDNPKRHVVERLIWLNAKGNKVVRDEPSFASYRPGTAPRAEPEFPRTRGTAKNGWTEVSDIFRAPKAATQVQVELSLRWQTNGRVEWRTPLHPSRVSHGWRPFTSSRVMGKPIMRSAGYLLHSSPRRPKRRRTLWCCPRR